MKVAIVHDYIKEYGGAERVLEALHELYPDAPVYTSVYLPEYLGPHKERFKNWNIKTSWAQSLPFKSKLISPLRLLAPFLFQSFDFSKFDVVIVSATGAYCSNAIKVKSQKSKVKNESSNSKVSNYTLGAKRYPLHICYCHTPPRYLYGYATAREWKKNIFFRVLGEIANHFLRIVDFKAAQRVDLFIANSEEVKSRIKKFYRKDATVIYPPVTSGISNLVYRISDRNTNSEIRNTSYYVAGGRLARAKHIDLIVKAFQELQLPLKVFGKGFAGYEKELGMRNKELGDKNHNSPFVIHNSNVEFVGEVSDSDKLELMKNAKTFIFAAEDEDFGITPVEAMSVGTPVIAYKSGGVKETVVDGKTGFFFDELKIESLKKAIHQFNNITIKPEDCIKQAERFSHERFLKEIGQIIEKASKST